MKTILFMCRCINPPPPAEQHTTIKNKAIKEGGSITFMLQRNIELLKSNHGYLLNLKKHQVLME